MNVNAIRVYAVEFEEGESAVMTDLFPGERIYSVTRLSDEPKIFRVETALSIQGDENGKWVEPIQGSMTIDGQSKADETEPDPDVKAEEEENNGNPI